MNRLAYIDIAKGLSMFLVILSHTGYVDRYVQAFYQPIFLTAFFFISGFFFVNKKIREGKYLIKFMDIAFSLLIPYLLYWIISYSVDSIIKGNYYFLDDLALSIIKGEKLWFASCLIVSELMALLYFMLVKPCIRSMILWAVFNLVVYLIIPHKLGLPWYIDVALFSNFYIAIGMIAKHYYNNFQNALSNVKLGILGGVIYLGMVIIDCLWVNNKGFFFGEFSNYPFFILESFVGIFACLFVCTRLENIKIGLVFIGQNSLLYYMFQNQILHLTRKLGEVCQIGHPNVLYGIASAIIVSLIMIIPVLFVNKYIPVMSGKFRLKRYKL